MTAACPRLTWEQALSWRLHQHQLDNRRVVAPEELADRLCGIHAQVLSSAELSLALRIEGSSPTAVRAALWKERLLVKTWAMRGTLHLLASESLPRYVSARAFAGHSGDAYWSADGVDLSEQDVRRITAAVGGVLRGRRLSRAELAAEVSKVLGRPDYEAPLRHGFGPLLKPAALAGDLCFGPSRGPQVTFVHPADWNPSALGGRPPVSPVDAMAAVVRDFLGGYGPTAPADVARWWGGLRVGDLTGVRESLSGEVVDVTVEGRRCWMLERDIEAVQAARPGREVRMLGGFDPYTVTLPRGVEKLLPKAARPAVYRIAGWISPVVLAGAAVVGTWRVPGPADAALHVDLLRPLTREERTGLESQAELVSCLLGCPPRLDVRLAASPS